MEQSWYPTKCRKAGLIVSKMESTSSPDTLLNVGKRDIAWVPWFNYESWYPTKCRKAGYKINIFIDIDSPDTLLNVGKRDFSF